MVSLTTPPPQEQLYFIDGRWQTQRERGNALPFVRDYSTGPKVERRLSVGEFTNDGTHVWPDYPTQFYDPDFRMGPGESLQGEEGTNTLAGGGMSTRLAQRVIVTWKPT